MWAYIANLSATGITTQAGNKIDVKAGDTAICFTPVLYPTQAEWDAAKQENKRIAYFLPLNVYLPITANFIYPGVAQVARSNPHNDQ